jgi:hypothetical protein
MGSRHAHDLDYSSRNFIMYQPKVVSWVWRDGSAVKNTGCSSRWPRCYSQHLHHGLKLSLTQLLGDLMSCSYLYLHCTNVAHKYTCRENLQTHYKYFKEKRERKKWHFKRCPELKVGQGSCTHKISALCSPEQDLHHGSTSWNASVHEEHLTRPQTWMKSSKWPMATEKGRINLLQEGARKRLSNPRTL